jgi:hypothetical protein
MADNDVKMADECPVLKCFDPIIRDYFFKELGHNQLTVVQVSLN